jgi:hypothetical protein
MGGGCQSKQVAAIDVTATLAAFKDDTNPTGQEEAARVLVHYIRESHDSDAIMALCLQHVPGWQNLVLGNGDGEVSSCADRGPNNVMKTGVQLVSGARGINSIHEVKVAPALVPSGTFEAPLDLNNDDHSPPRKCLFTILLVGGETMMDLAWWTRAGNQEFRRLSTFRAGKYATGLPLGTERSGSLPVVCDGPGQRGAQHQTPDPEQLPQVHEHYSALRLHSSLRRGRRTDSSANEKRMAAHRAHIDAKLQLYDERQSTSAPWAVARLSLQGPASEDGTADAGVARLEALQNADYVRLRAHRTQACIEVPYVPLSELDHDIEVHLRENFADEAGQNDPGQLEAHLKAAQRFARLRTCMAATRQSNFDATLSLAARRWGRLRAGIVVPGPESESAAAPPQSAPPAVLFSRKMVDSRPVPALPLPPVPNTALPAAGVEEL